MIVEMDDDQYKDTMLTPELRKYVVEFEQEYVSTLQDYKMHISPSFWEVKGSNFALSGILGKTYYATSYPSYIDFLWTRDLLNYYAKRDMSRFIYPADDSTIQ